jgi:hypothetical protein
MATTLHIAYVEDGEPGRSCWAADIYEDGRWIGNTWSATSDGSPIGLRSAVDEFGRRYPGAELVLHDRDGHYRHVHMPDAVVRAETLETIAADYEDEE